MNLLRFQPFYDLARREDDVGSVFDDFFTRTDSGTGLIVPPLDVAETDNEITVKMDIPGVKKEEIDITVHEGVLAVKGERKFEKEENNKRFHRIERGYGQFTRTLALPDTVDGESIKGDYREGVLTITMRKREETKPKQIKVNVG